MNSEKGSSPIAVYKSKRLENLYYGSKTIVWIAPSGTNHSEAIWAPYLQYIHGNWYVYYTATSGGASFVNEKNQLYTIPSCALNENSNLLQNPGY